MLCPQYNTSWRLECAASKGSHKTKKHNLPQQNRRTCKRTNSTFSTTTQRKKTKKELANRPTRRLMRNYFWIILFALYLISFIYNFNQQSEFTFYKLMLWLLQCLDGESSSGESPVSQIRPIGQFHLRRLCSSLTSRFYNMWCIFGLYLLSKERSCCSAMSVFFFLRFRPSADIYFCWNPNLFAICIYIFSKLVLGLGVMARGMALINALP
jgi:hypothetical protein